MINKAFISLLKNHPRGLFIKELGCLATSSLISLLLRKKGQIQIIYRGGILYPSIKDSDELLIVGSKEVQRGDYVLFIDDEGFPDIMRIIKSKYEHFILGADSIAFKKMKVRKSSIRGVVESINRNGTQIHLWKFFNHPSLYTLYNSLSSLFREIAEIFNRPLFYDESQATKKVGEKYELDAQYFSGEPSGTSDTYNLNIMMRYIKGGKALVVGSGTGREAIALAKIGCKVLGIDLSPRMIEIAKEKTKENSVDIIFAIMDVSSLALKDYDYSAIVFTPDVYSYIQNKKIRVNMLRELSHRLHPGGKILFSVKYYASIRSFLKMNLSNFLYKLISLWKNYQKIEFGDWHTKFLDSRGDVQFSYCRFFRKSEIRKEINKAQCKLLDNIQAVWIVKKND